ncbi:unnamed protein product [Rotaria sp. Silwood1]|nr:unnamed protein product [Rotaria sp. Silwood1]
MSLYDEYRHQHVVGLEGGIDPDYDQLKKHLSDTFSNIQIYQDLDACVDFLCNLSEGKTRVYLILLGLRTAYMAELISDWPQIAHIYLYDQKSEQPLLSNNKYLRFSTNSSRNLFISLVRDIELEQGIPPAMTYFTSNTLTTERSLRDLCSDHQSATFVWHQLLIDVIRQLPRKLSDKEEMIDFLRSYFQDDIVQQQHIDEFIAKYESKDAIRWYTKPEFLFRVLNRAFRTQNIDNIFTLRYFLQDLYHQLENEYQTQREWLESVIVHRGQLMYQDDFDALLKNSEQGNLIAFNSFLSTTFDLDVASVFAGSNTNTNPNEIPVIFQLVLNLEQSKLPIVNITHFSSVRSENETLIAMGSVFRIDQITEDKENRVWHVELTLNDEVSERLSSMIRYLKEQTGNQSTLIVLGRFLALDDPDLVATLNNLALVYADKRDYANALMYCQKSLDSIKILPTESISIGMTYYNVGCIYAKMEKHSEAIKYFVDALNACRQIKLTPVISSVMIQALYQKGRTLMVLDQNGPALECFVEALLLASGDDKFHSQIALVHHSIGQIHELKEDFSQALSSYEKALHIWMHLLEKNSKVDQHVVAQLLNDIGEVHDKNKRYWLAMSFYDQAIKFAEGNNDLVQEYKQNFQEAAEMTMHKIKRILNVYLVEFE